MRLPAPDLPVAPVPEPTTSEPPGELTAQEIDFLLRFGAALHRYGAPAHRLEDLLGAVLARRGASARFFSSPTALFASFGTPESLKTGLVRVEPGEMDLSRLSEIDALAHRIIEDGLPLADANAELVRIVSRPHKRGMLANVAAFGLAAGCAARLFGGGLAESAVAGGIGLLVGVVVSLFGASPATARVTDPVAAFLCSLLALVASRLVAPIRVEVATVAGLIVLLPGLSLTIALNELSSRHLIAGTSRLFGAGIVFLQLAFGVAMGARLGSFAPLLTEPAARPDPPGWTIVPALAGTAVALHMLFRGRLRDTGFVLVSGAAAYLGARVGTDWLGAELGAFVGALLLGTFANLVARLQDRPAVVTIVPGLMLLVPGSLGLRSLESLLANDVVTGVATAFSMVLVAVAIVAGLLLSNVAVPPRRSL